MDRTDTGTELTCVATEGDRGAVLLVVTGELDRDTAAGLRDCVDRLAARPDVADLSLDLSRLEFIDARGVGTLVEARDGALRHGVQVRVVAASRAVRWVLDIVGVDLA